MKLKGLTTVEGEFEVDTQYHFYMETQSVIARPSEKGQIDMYAATQWQDNVHKIVSQTLGKPQHLINVHTRRIGKGFQMRNMLCPKIRIFDLEGLRDVVSKKC